MRPVINSSAVIEHWLKYYLQSECCDFNERNRSLVKLDTPSPRTTPFHITRFPLACKSVYLVTLLRLFVAPYTEISGTLFLSTFIMEPG